jgi:glycosyltransferase involved in cell wall biosynthesis
MTARIAVLFPKFSGGGSEFVASCMLQVLSGCYETHLFTLAGVDFREVDRYFGTHLDGSGVTVDIPLTIVPGLLHGPAHLPMTIRQHLLSYSFRRWHEEFDLGIAAFNEMDLGNRGIQYIHAPLFGRGSDMARRVLGYPASPVRMIYQRLCERASGYSEERMRANLTLTNSRWTADLVGCSHHIEAEVLYPPVIMDPPGIPWGDRESGFVCVGRISPEKNLETVIEIIRRVRQEGSDTHLHILGSGGDPKYRRRVASLCEKNESWLFLEEGLDRAELAKTLAGHRFGIHGWAAEGFGIGIAEMVRAGCIPFVPDGGGQVEVVGENGYLTFRDPNQAVEKILKVMSDEMLARDLTLFLRARAGLFSYERFAEQFLAVVHRMMKGGTVV